MTIDPEQLKLIYQQRPDLQKYYSPEGVAINANLPEISHIPTLQDWAAQYGINEYPQLDSRYTTLSKFYTPEEIAGMPDDIKTGLAAFADVQQKNFESGKANAEINSQTWADAMKTASEDPVIGAKYGDELKAAQDSVGKALGYLDAGYTQEQAATARQQELDTQKLAENEAAAGRAYSGFRTQAENRLKADQNDVITSSRMNLKKNVQNTLSPYERRFGSTALHDVLPGVKDVNYDPIGGITGSAAPDKLADEKAYATDLYNTTALPTTTQTGLPNT